MMKSPDNKSLLKGVEDLPEIYEALSGVPGFMPVIPCAMQFYHRDRAKLEREKHMGPRFAFLHNRHVMIVCLKGERSVIVDDFSYILRRGSGMIIFPGQKHRFEQTKGADFSCLFASFDAFSGADALSILKERIFSVDKTGMARLKKLVDTYHRAWAGDTTESQELVYLFGSFLNRILAENNTNAPGTSHKIDHVSSQRIIVREINNYVQSNLRRSIRLRDIARKLGVSESHLRMVFRKEIGVSLGKFIIHARMHKATALLRSSDMNISLVAQACGYGSVNAFCRIFRKEAKATPLQFRAKCRH